MALCLAYNFYGSIFDMHFSNPFRQLYYELNQLTPEPPHPPEVQSSKNYRTCSCRFHQLFPVEIRVWFDRLLYYATGNTLFADALPHWSTHIAVLRRNKATARTHAWMQAHQYRLWTYILRSFCSTLNTHDWWHRTISYQFMAILCGISPQFYGNI